LFFVYAAMSLHVESFGASCGPDLVLLHGWAMHSGVWRSVRDHLAEHFRLHLVDLPGHGFSPACAFDLQGNTSDCMLESIAEILPESCTICGWSLGGEIAIELALREPVRIRKLVLVSTTPCFVKRESWQWGMEASMLQLFAQNLKRDYRTTMKRFLTLQVNGGSDTASTLSRLRKSLAERKEPDEAALEAGLQILLTSDLREKLKYIRQPVLLLHGENDVITHPSAAKWMSAQLRESELIMLPHCGHAPFLSHPDQFIKGLIQLRDGAMGSV
jgi:pimeloyl-[acyl-carrier protein] methyl ester esterase